MPRRLRCNMGGYVYHVLNRGVGRATLFHKEGDYAALEKALRQAKQWQPLRLLGYCLMPNHWHLVLWPEQDGDLSEFLRWRDTPWVERTAKRLGLEATLRRQGRPKKATAKGLK